MKKNSRLKQLFIPKGGILEIADVLLLVLCVLGVILVVRPDLIFSSTIPTGGDYGGHLEVPWYIRTHLLSQGRVAGWSPDWYDGWPLNVFYFPTPSLLIALFSFIIPYVVAFKLVVVLGSILLPIAIWSFAREVGVFRPGPALFAVASLHYLANEAYQIDGGNIFSTMAGEYSFSLSLAFTIFFFSKLVKYLKTGRHRSLVAILFALSLSSHLLGGAIAILGSLIIITFFYFESFKKFLFRVINLAAIGIIGFFVTGIWSVPFAWNISYTTNMGYSKVTTYMANLFPHAYLWPLAFGAAGGVCALFWLKKYWLGVSVLAVSGVLLVLSVPGEPILAGVIVLTGFFGIKRRPVAIFIAIFGIVGLLGFRYLPASGKLYNPRALPLYSLAIYMSFAQGVTDIIELCVKVQKYFTRSEFGLVVRRAPTVRIVVALLATILTVIPLGYSLTGHSDLLGYNVVRSDASSWISWNFEGYQGKKPYYTQYKAVMNTMDSIGKKYGCGRAMWEYSSNLNNFGTPMSLMLLPYFTNGCIDSSEGLFFESSPTTPFHFLNQSELSAAPDYAMSGLDYSYGIPNVALGVEHMQLMGIRYFMCFSSAIESQAATNPDLTLIATSGPWYFPGSDNSNSTQTWQMYLVSKSSQVTPLVKQPVVASSLVPPNASNATIGSYTNTVENWYLTPSEWQTEILTNGPASYERVTPISSPNSIGVTEIPVFSNSELSSQNEPKDKVTDIKSGADSISFHVSKIGVPVLVKISYFPSWYVSGGTGPYRASPNLMVVIPTSNNVSLHFGRGSYDWLGAFLTGLGIVGLLAFLLFERRLKVRQLVKGDLWK